MVAKAKELFERYVAGGANYVLQIVQDKTPETLHLDFKEWMPNSNAKEDLGYYAKALSGFANAEGGVLVWGVKCKSAGGDEPDVTQDATPIEGLRAFVNRLEGKTDEFLQPGINGVVHEPLELGQGTDKGFVVSYIPRAEGPPQMSVASSSRGFFCRMGSRTKPMEHYQIADRFRERPQPRLEVFLLGGRVEGATTKVANRQIDVCVRNSGAGIGNHVAVSVLTSASLNAHSHIQKKLNILPVGGNNSWRTFALPLEEPLYPGSYSRLAYFQWSFPTDESLQMAEVTVEYRAFCDGAFAEGTLAPKLAEAAR